MGRGLPDLGEETGVGISEVRDAKMADERRHDRRNARSPYATGDLGLRIRDVRQRFLPTEHGPVALPSETGAIYEYQIDSSSKRPVSSVTLASRESVEREL